MIVCQHIPPAPFPLHKARKCYVDKPKEFSEHERSIVTKQRAAFLPEM